MNPLNYEFFGLPTLRGKLFNDVKKIVPTEVCLESEGWREDTYFISFLWESLSMLVDLNPIILSFTNQKLIYIYLTYLCEYTNTELMSNL